MHILTTIIYKNNIPNIIYITYRHNLVLQKYFMFALSRFDLSNKHKYIMLGFNPLR